MAEINKEVSKIIKCSNPPKDRMDPIKCMSIESALKGYLIGMIWIYSKKVQVNEEQFMPSEYLQSALSNALNSFPVLSGRLTEDELGNFYIHLTNEGVRFTESRCLNQDLNYFLNPMDENKEFDYENINSSDLTVEVSRDGTGPMLSIQITRLLCGSVILSLSSFHCLMDAQSVSSFINCWARNGKILENRPATMDRTFIEEKQKHFPDLRPVNCVYNRNLHGLGGSPFIQPQGDRVICHVYYFSTEELKRIKHEAMKDLSIEIDYVSTYDALYAHLIMVLMQATETSFSNLDKLKVLQPFNGRSCFSPLARDYFGAFTFWLYSEIPTDREITLSFLAQLIHQMYAQQNQHSLKAYNAYLSSDDGNIGKNRVDADIIHRDFHCTAWRKFEMLKANFHGTDDGDPVFTGPTKYRGSRFSIMLDANKDDQSIYVIFGLNEQHYRNMIRQNLLHKYRESALI